MKKHLAIFIFISGLAQAQPSLKLDIYDGISPIWSHLVIDSSYIGTDGRDGMDHYIGNAPYPPLIHDNYYYNILVNFLSFEQGAIIEKIDIRNGQRAWYQTYDLRNNDREEIPSYSYINSNNELEVLNFKNNEKPSPFPIIRWIASSLSIRKYDLNTGLLKQNIIKQYDSSQLILKNFSGSTKLLPKYNSRNKYTYHLYGSQGDKIITDYVEFDSQLESNINIRKFEDKTLAYHDNHFKQALSPKLDSFISFIRTQDTKEWTPSTNFNFLINYYNGEMELIGSYDITKQLPNYRGFNVKSITDGMISILAINQELDTDIPEIYNYTFDYKGQLIGKFLIPNKTIPVLLNYSIINLKNNKGVLIARPILLPDNSINLEFLLTDVSGNVKAEKIIHIKEKLYPTQHYIYEMEDGNILFNGTFKSLISGSKVENKNGRSVVSLFKAEDLGIITQIKETEKKTSFCNVFPNPSFKNVIVEFSSNFNGSISIINLLGSKIYNEKIPNKRIHYIDIQQYPVGSYILQLTDDKNKIHTEQFVIAR